MSELCMITARGSMGVVNSLNFQDQIRALGFHEPEWKLLTQKTCWLGKQRPVIERLCQSLIFSMLDLIGVPRFEVPAEWVAAVGASFISECNYFAFSSWVGRYARAEELGNYDGARAGSIEGLERVTASQLFALIIKIRSDEECELLNRMFTHKAAESLPNPIQEEENEQKPKK